MYAVTVVTLLFICVNIIMDQLFFFVLVLDTVLSTCVHLFCVPPVYVFASSPRELFALVNVQREGSVQRMRFLSMPSVPWL